MNRFTIMKDFIKKNGKKSELSKGHTLNESFEKYLYFVDKGILYINQDNADGTTLIYKIVSPNNLLICDKFKYFYGKTDATFYKVPIRIIKNNNGLYNLYMKLLVLENIKKDMFIRDMLTRNKLSSFLSVLIRLSNTFGVVEKDMVIIKIKITQEELAQYCGTTRENVARIIKQLKDKNILDTSSHFIKVINIEEIKKMIPCENCENFVCNSF